MTAPLPKASPGRIALQLALALFHLCILGAALSGRGVLIAVLLGFTAAVDIGMFTTGALLGAELERKQQADRQEVHR